jgi:hypothetical protein
MKCKLELVASFTCKHARVTFKVVSNGVTYRLHTPVQQLAALVCLK